MSRQAPQNQLELFPRDPCEHLFPYWKKQLMKWPREVMQFRHYTQCTGWSMCCQSFMFARNLFRHGQINKAEFRRWFRFRRRVWRWDSLKVDGRIKEIS